MKKIKYSILAILAASGICTGCFNLDEVPYSEILQERFEPSDQDVAAYLASAYTELAYWFDWQGAFDAMEEPADVVITPVRPNGWDDGGTYQRMHKHTWDAEEWQPWNTYETCYSGINNCNRVKDQIESGALNAGDAAEAMIDELRAVRALWYSILLDTHGNVPIVTAFTDEVPTQATRQQVYDFVVKELTEVLAGGHMTKEKSAATYTRLNYWSTSMILMRVYLNAEVYTGTEQYAKALAIAEEIIADSPYALSATYSENFKVALNESNTEVMFAIPYDGSTHTTGGHVFSQCRKWYPPVSKSHFGWSFQCWGGSCANPTFVDSYQPGDTRKELTWMYGPALDPNGNIVWTNLNYLPSLTSKNDSGQSMTSIDYGLRQQKYEPDTSDPSYFTNDVPYFRLAEAYYTAAECILRGKASTHGNTAVDLVNAVRTRVAPATTEAVLRGNTKMVYGLVPWGAATYAMWTEHDATHDWSSVVETLESSQKPVQSGQDAAAVFLGGMYDEWGWEFALEGLRRQQMIRFGTFSTKNWFNHEAIPDGHTALFPIPLDVLNTNPNLKQNPGY